MIKVIANWILDAVALYVVAYLVPGIHLESFGAALVAIIIIGLLNAIVKPILVLLTLPVTILTLGLFVFIINALMLFVAGSITPGFRVDGFMTAIVGSLLLTVVTMIFHSLVK